jgi:hypothetical protein
MNGDARTVAGCAPADARFCIAAAGLGSDPVSITGVQ